MLRDLSRTSALEAARCVAAVVLVIGCGDAIKTPFFEQAGNAGMLSGPTGGTNGGNLATGGDAGSPLGGAAPGGSSGSAGLAGDAGSGAEAGTGSGGAAGANFGGAGSGISGMAGMATGGTTGGVDCSGADPAAVAFDGHCYVLRTTPRTWAAAREDCASGGGHLVTLSSQGRSESEFLAENEFVWMLGGAIEKWIGATDGLASNQSGNGTLYTWITGEPMTFDNWSGGQPNNAQSACMDNAPCSCGDMCWEHCGFMWNPGNEPGTWNDRHCEHVIPYVCEWDTPPM